MRTIIKLILCGWQTAHFETSFNRVVLQVSTNMGKEKQDIEQCKDLCERC